MHKSVTSASCSYEICRDEIHICNITQLVMWQVHKRESYGFVYQTNENLRKWHDKLIVNRAIESGLYNIAQRHKTRWHVWIMVCTGTTSTSKIWVLPRWLSIKIHMCISQNQFTQHWFIAKVFVCKQWRGFGFDSGWQRSLELPFEASKRRKKFYLPTRRHQLRHWDLRY